MHNYDYNVMQLACINPTMTLLCILLFCMQPIQPASYFVQPLNAKGSELGEGEWPGNALSRNTQMCSEVQACTVYTVPHY